MSKLPTQVGLMIRARRKRLGLSQEALAALAGISRTYLGEVERGAVNVSVLTLERIAKALQLKLCELVAVDDKK